MNYNSAKKLLTSKGKFYINLGLERISAVLESFGNPQDNLEFIHVAGTNGKGSVCAILDAVLKQAGMKTGLYTSPHLFKYTERIKINGNDISGNDFAFYVFKVSNEADNIGVHLTEFEILTAAAFLYFNDNRVDVVILETGLGGRFDATNIIKSNLCAIITHIDLDHTERLGDTKEKIAFEKAGIIKPECPVITCEEYEAIKDNADKNSSLLLMTAPIGDISSLALKGLCQQENLSLALSAISLVYPNITQNVIEEGLKNVKHPCRFQYIKDKNIIVDGSHNPNGIKALRESLDYYFPNKSFRFIFGCLKNKDYKKMIKELFKNGDEICFYHFDNTNSCTTEELQAVCDLPSKEWDMKFSPDKLNVVCGSFYMLSEIIPAEFLV